MSEIVDSWMFDNNDIKFDADEATPQDKMAKSTFGLKPHGKNLFNTSQSNRRNQPTDMSSDFTDEPQKFPAKSSCDAAVIENSYDTNQCKAKNKSFAMPPVVPENPTNRRNVIPQARPLERSRFLGINNTKIDSLQSKLPTKIKPGATLKGNKNQSECESNVTQNNSNTNNFVAHLAQKPKSSNAKLMQIRSKLTSAVTDSVSTVKNMIIEAATNIFPNNKNNFRPKDNKAKILTLPPLEVETKRKTRQSTKSSEVIIISDDEEEVEEDTHRLQGGIDTKATVEESSILPNINLSAVASMTADPMTSVHQKIYRDNNETPPSHPPAVGTPRFFGYFEVVPVATVYLGRKAFHSKDKSFSIQIVTAKSRFDLSIYSDLDNDMTTEPCRPNAIYNSNSLNQQLQLQPWQQCPLKKEFFSKPEHIPFEDIKGLIWGMTTFPEANNKYFIAIELLQYPSTLYLHYATIGDESSCDLQPGLPTNTLENPSKFIVMLLSIDNFKKFVDQINGNEGISQLRKISHQLGEVDLMTAEDNQQNSSNSLSLQQSQHTPPILSDEMTERIQYYYLAAIVDRNIQQQKQNIQQAAPTTSPIILCTPTPPQSQTEGRKMRTRNKKKIQQELVLTPEDAETLVLYPFETESQDVITLCRGDLKRLAPEEYLNDSLIDFKLKFMLIDRRHIYYHPIATSHVHIFSTLFYTKLTEKSSNDRSAKGRHSLVERWTKGVDIFTKKLIFIPINLSGHWSLSVLVNIGNSFESEENTNRNMSMTNVDHNNTAGSKSSSSSDDTQRPFLVSQFAPCLLFLDSLSCHPRPTITNILQHYLEQEWKVKYKTDRKFVKQLPVVDCSNWIPHQPNAYDCGLYVIKYAEELYHSMFQLVVSSSSSTTSPLPSPFTTPKNNKNKSRQREESMDDFISISQTSVVPVNPKSQLSEAVKSGLLLGKNCFGNEDVSMERVNLEQLLLELSRQWRAHKIAKKKALKKCEETSELDANNDHRTTTTTTTTSHSNVVQSTQDTLECNNTSHQLDKENHSPSLECDSDSDSEMDVDHDGGDGDGDGGDGDGDGDGESKDNEEVKGGGEQDNTTSTTAASSTNDDNNNDTSPTDSTLSLSSSLSMHSDENGGHKTANNNNSVEDLLSDDEDNEINIKKSKSSIAVNRYLSQNTIHYETSVVNNSEVVPTSSNKSIIHENTLNMKCKAIVGNNKRERDSSDIIVAEMKNTSENNNSNYNSDSTAVKISSMKHQCHHHHKVKRVCTRGNPEAKKIREVFETNILTR